MPIKPRNYQLEGVAKIERFRIRALLADEMGLGKTYQALLVGKRNFLRPIIVVCPAFLKWNWEREAARLVRIRAEILNGTKVPRAKWRLYEPQMIIINYEILSHWVDKLKRLRPDLVIVDEVHYIKSRSAKRTRAVQRLCKGVKRVICLSGTPMTSRPVELWPTIHLLRPDVFPDFSTYAHRYCKPEWTPWGWQFRGASNLDELRVALRKTCMIRRLKQDVEKELPAKTRSVVPMALSNRREYDEAFQTFASWLRRKHPSKALRSLKAEQFTKSGYLKRLVAELKLPGVIDWVRNFLADSDGKLILFAWHTKILERLHFAFEQSSVLVDGRVTGIKRQRCVDRFQHDPKCRIFVGQLAATGIGWNGTAASAVAFAELGWTPGEHTQAEDRAHRIGQTRPITCYYLVGRDTIEDKLCKLIRDKQKVLTTALDGGGQDSMRSVFDELLNDIRKAA